MFFAFRVHDPATLVHSSKHQPRARCRMLAQRLRIGIAALAVSALSATAAGYTAVTVAWDANPESDVVGYRVYLGTTSAEFSQVVDVGPAVSATLPNLLPSTTYYCAVQAYDSRGLASPLSGEITFTTKSPAAIFSAWAADGRLQGFRAFPAAMPFHDGVPNLLKYAFNLNPSGADQRYLTPGSGTAGLAVVTLDQSGAQTTFKVEFLRRKGCGLLYAAQITSDMKTYTPMTALPVVSAIDTDWERVCIEQPCNVISPPTLFGRVEVTLP